MPTGVLLGGILPGGILPVSFQLMSGSASGLSEDNGFGLLRTTPLFAAPLSVTPNSATPNSAKNPTTEVAKPSSADKKTSVNGRKAKKGDGNCGKAEKVSRQSARIAAEEFSDSVQVRMGRKGGGKVRVWGLCGPLKTTQFKFAYFDRLSIPHFFSLNVTNFL